MEGERKRRPGQKIKGVWKEVSNEGRKKRKKKGKMNEGRKGKFGRME